MSSAFGYQDPAAARAARTCAVISRALAGKRKRAPASWWRRCRPPAPRWPPRAVRSSEPPPSTSRAAAPAAECEWMAHVDNFTVQLLHLLLRLPVVTTVSACYYINLLVLVLLLLGRDRVAVCFFLAIPKTFQARSPCDTQHPQHPPALDPTPRDRRPSPEQKSSQE